LCNKCRPQPASIAPSIPVLNALFGHNHCAKALYDKICAACIGDNTGTTYANKFVAQDTSVGYGAARCQSRVMDEVQLLLLPLLKELLLLLLVILLGVKVRE